MLMLIKTYTVYSKIYCMIFIAIAMTYYGLILFKLRKTSKEEEKVLVFNAKDVQLSDSIIKCDRSMLFIFVTFFLIFNLCYFIIIYY